MLPPNEKPPLVDEFYKTSTQHFQVMYFYSKQLEQLQIIKIQLSSSIFLHFHSLYIPNPSSLELPSWFQFIGWEMDLKEFVFHKAGGRGGGDLISQRNERFFRHIRELFFIIFKFRNFSILPRCCFRALYLMYPPLPQPHFVYIFSPTTKPTR